MLPCLYFCDLMDLFGFCDLTDLSGLSNCFVSFGLVSSAGIDYFWFLTLDCCIWTLIYQNFGSI